MKNNSKRICALLLAIVMCIGCVVPVFAETSNVHTHAEAVCPGENAEHTMTNCTNVFVRTAPAECGKIGYDLYECTTCHTPIATNWTNVDSEGHTWGEYVQTKAPTCFEEGEKVRNCTKCGAKDDPASVAKREHDITIDKVGNYVCKDGIPAWKEWCTYEDCDYEVEHVAEPGHDCEREIVEILKAPTCYETGLAKVACKHPHCSYAKADVVVLTTTANNAVGPHSWVFASITKEATCGTAASGTVKCSVCGAVADVVANGAVAEVTVKYVAIVDNAPVEKTVVIDVTSLGFAPTGVHNFTDDVPASTPSCEGTGVLAHSKCGMCGAITLDKTVASPVVVPESATVVPATDHDWEDFAEVPSNCTTAGTKAHSKCKTCGTITLDRTAATLVKVEASALVIAPAHSYDLTGAPVAESQPTCTKFGFKFYGCTICGMPASASGNENINLPANEAGWVSAGVYRIPMLPHDCTETVTPGTCTTPTVTVYDCNDCDYIKTVTGNVPGHTWVSVKYEATCQHDGYTFDYCSVCALVSGADASDGISIVECVTVRIETTAEAAGTLAVTDSKGKYNKVDKDPDNHEWDPAKQVVATSPTCTAPGESLDYCPYCSVYEKNPIPAEGHNTYDYVSTVQPTCEVDGYLVYKCSVCGGNEVHLTPAQLTENHDDYAVNSVLDLEALGHEASTVVANHVAPTCSANGSDRYNCVRFGQNGCTYYVTEVLDSSNNKPLYPALDHKYSDGTSSKYTVTTDPHCVVSDTALTGENGYVTEKCYQCDYSAKIADIIFDWNNPDHHPGAIKNPDTVYHNGVKYDTPALADQAAIAAGATEADGLYRKGDCEKSQLVDYSCPNCSKTFFAEDDSMVGSHQGTPAGYDAPDCTNAGTYAHYECTVCKDENGNPNKILVNADGDHVIYKDASELVISATGHTWTAQTGSAATCTSSGVKAHYTCTCGAISLDGKTTTTESLAIDALDHKWGEKGGAVAPSCDVAGVLAHHECEMCDAVSLDGTTVATSIVDPALSHNYIHSTLVPPACVDAGYQYHYCNICGDEYVDNYKYPLGHKFQDVNKVGETCAVAGTMAHVKCTECGELFAEGTTDVLSESYVTAESLVISATGKHVYANGSPIKNTCAPGVRFEPSATCDVCKGEISIEHTALEKNDVDATCTEYGYTVEYCKDCGHEEVTTKKAEFAPTGHNYQWVVTTPAEMYKGGVESYKCVAGNGSKGCGDVKETRATDPIGGIEFSYELDNAIVSGAEYVNGGIVKLTVNYKAANVNLASVNIRLNYDSSVLSYHSGDFVCNAVDAATELRIFDINNAKIGGAGDGFVVINATTTGFGETTKDKTLNGEGVFAVIYFNIKKNVDEAPIWFAVDKTASVSPSLVLEADGDKVATNFGAEVDGKVINAPTKSLGDIDQDDRFTSADTLEFLGIAKKYSQNPATGYSAVADINQDGIIGSDDYEIIRDVILGSIDPAKIGDYAAAVIK